MEISVVTNNSVISFGKSTQYCDCGYEHEENAGNPVEL